MSSVKYIKIVGGALSTTNSPTDDLSIGTLTTNGNITIAVGSGGVLGFADGSIQSTAAITGTNYWTLSGSDIYNNNGSGLGKVGIGTAATPTYQLQVQGAITSGYNGGTSNTPLSLLLNKHNSGGSNQYSSLMLQVSGDNSAHVATGQIVCVQEVAGSNAGALAFVIRKSDGTYFESMRITSDGFVVTRENVGIGVNSPDSPLFVYGLNSPSYVSQFHEYDESSYAAGFYNDTYDSGTACLEILVLDDGTATVGTSGTNDIHFHTNGSTSTRMSILGSTGYVGITTKGPEFPLDVAGDVRIRTTSKLYFGGTGSSDNDTDLYRSAANNLKTDDALTVVGAFQADSANNTLVVDATNHRVGIGTASPAAKLEVHTSDSSGSPGIYLLDTSSTHGSGTFFNFAILDLAAGNGAVSGQFGSNYGTNSSYPPWLEDAFYITTRTDHPIIFSLGATTTERMRITYDGRVGIGTNNPVSWAKLDIKGLSVIGRATSSADQGATVLYDETSHASVQFSQRGSAMAGNMGLPNGSAELTTGFSCLGISVAGSGSTTPYLAFGTGPNDPVERMRIINDGKVGINTTIPYFLVDAAGDIRVRGANKLYFGGTGASDNDTNLYRSAADTLKTDDTFNAVTDLQKNGKPVARWRGVSAGAPGTDVLDGDLYYDSGDSKVYIRANSSWIALT